MISDSHACIRYIYTQYIHILLLAYLLENEYCLYIQNKIDPIYIPV